MSGIETGIETGNKKGKEGYNSSNKPELSKLRIESKENQKQLSKSNSESFKSREKELTIKETKNDISKLQAEILLQKKLETISDNTKVSKKFKLGNIINQNSPITEITGNNGKKYEKDISTSIKNIQKNIKELPERIQNIPGI